MNWCYENFIQYKSLVRARDVRDQIKGLCERVEIPPSTTKDTENIRKAITSGCVFLTYFHESFHLNSHYSLNLNCF
jgi:pre-mRNA-splicing factor ATP-dependent RNA helicase DHX16